MTIRILAALVAVALVLSYLAPMAIKMKDLALAGVIVFGAVVMLVDLWQSVRDSQD